MLVQLLLHRLVPSRLDANSHELRLRVWRTWDGLFDGFSRSRAALPREQLRGIAFGIAQGGGTQLFVAHESGYDCYAGFTGEDAKARELGDSILEWLSGGAPLAAADEVR